MNSFRKFNKTGIIIRGNNIPALLTNLFPQHL